MENNDTLTICSLAPLIRNKKLSPVEATIFFLQRISRLQPAINAYITVASEVALAQAKKAEQEIIKGHYRGSLHGIPISIKDLFYTKGIRTTAGSSILKRFVPQRNAAAIDSLLDAGCILLGKTNIHEFAYGCTNINPHYGPVCNPWNPAHISGGSSGGSAASVVTGQAVASLGTDTGGSIRIPAAACGCIGFKPTYGRISLDGVIPLAGSLDHVGPLSRCVMDSALLYQALAGPMAWSPYSEKSAFSMIRKHIRGLRIGLPRQYFFCRIQSPVQKAIQTACEVFEQLGAVICELNLPGLGETASIAADITAAEALAYHIKWLDKNPDKYGKDLRIRLEQSRKMTALTYLQALQKKEKLTEQMERTLDSVHALLTPTLPMTAPKIIECQTRGNRQDEIRTALLSLTRPANISGLPAISVPCGFSHGLPIGMQIIGRRHDEATTLRIAYAYETATDWHQRFPRENDWQTEML
jgi:aspartyl-tRNA(Asn)/glutamyl-tRNA(Gln) amidotransferase subunit A